MERKTYALGNVPKPVLRPDFHKLNDLCGEIFQNFSFAKWKDIDHKNTNRCIYIKSCKDLCWENGGEEFEWSGKDIELDRSFSKCLSR